MSAIGLRFFTGHGPWGRPDMALYLFTDAILAGRPIKVFNNGQMSRDFTYIDYIGHRHRRRCSPTRRASPASIGLYNGNTVPRRCSTLSRRWNARWPDRR